MTKHRITLHGTPHDKDEKVTVLVSLDGQVVFAHDYAGSTSIQEVMLAVRPYTLPPEKSDNS